MDLRTVLKTRPPEEEVPLTASKMSSQDIMAFADPDVPLSVLSDYLQKRMQQFSAGIARLKGTVAASLECDATLYREHLVKTLRGWMPYLVEQPTEIMLILMVFALRLEGNDDALETVAGGGASTDARGPSDGSLGG